VDVEYKRFASEAYMRYKSFWEAKTQALFAKTDKLRFPGSIKDCKIKLNKSFLNKNLLAFV
jgi:hypothetical protein